MDWVWELHRYDATERFTAIHAEESHRVAMRSICYDIRCNPPTYQFDILTQRGSHLRLALMLPDCNPGAAQLGMRIPESSIVASHRRTRACQPAEAAEIRVIGTPGTPLSE
jgi:hypothetical protein